MLRKLKLVRTPGRNGRCKDRDISRPHLGFCLRGSLRRYGLIDLQIGHLQFAKKIEQESVFLGREVSLGFFVQRIQHVDQLMRGFRVDYWLTGARVSVSAQDHGRIAAEHTHEIFERRGTLGNFGRSLRRGGLGSFGDGVQFFLALGLAFFFFHRLLAGFTLRSEGAAVDNSERVFLFVIGQGDNPLQYLSG
jgi:hypothetical protein